MIPEIVYGSRSSHDALDWDCECGAFNKKVQRLFFSVPTFECPNCGRKYLDYHAFDFCLADVMINGKHLVQRVLDQGSKPECLSYACAQALLIMYNVDCIMKRLDPVPWKVQFDPTDLYNDYYKKYPLMKDGDKEKGIVPDARHKFIKIAARLKEKGIEIGKGKFYKIGETSSIPKDEYETMCEELADGVPLLAVFIPGMSFGGLEYCKMYIPANLQETNECNKKPKPHKVHPSHMVVLLGPASRLGMRGFFFLNSYGEIWCPRMVLEEISSAVNTGISSWLPRLFGEEIPRTVRGGVGKVQETGLVWNVMKFCRPSDAGGFRQFVAEEEDEDHKYGISRYNKYLIW